MRKETVSKRLNSSKAFSMNRISNTYNFETGVSGTLGLITKLNKII